MMNKIIPITFEYFNLPHHELLKLITNEIPKMIKLPILISFSLIMLTCTPNRKMATVETYPFEILFGSTGGFSNINPVYIVKSTGEVLKKGISSSEPNAFKMISKQKIDSIYLLIKQSDFGNLKINQISNFTHYIEIKSNKVNNKIMWFNDSQIPVEVKKLYDTLIRAIKK